MRRFSVLLVAVLGLAPGATAHDIPNEQVDRAIQATLSPGRLRIDYEVSLAELTLAQDLRRLAGVVRASDRREYFDRYGDVTAPLNARGLLVALGGRALPIRVEGFDLAVEEHPRYTFHFAAELPAAGHLSIRDTNYVESRGTSRLAVRGLGVTIRGDDLPADVEAVETKPTWMLSDEEERRTRAAEFEFESEDASIRPVVPPAVPPSPPSKGGRRREWSGVSGLLDRAGGLSWLVVGLLAIGLGAAHAIQPGHGKTLVAAATVGGRGRLRDGLLLAAVTTIAHMGSVLLIALGLWLTRTTRYAAWNSALAQAAGFVIAAVGFWRLGHHLAGFGEHDDEGSVLDVGGRGLVGLGAAGGLVPCWDAVLLVVLAEAVGRLGFGLFVLAMFSLGMAAVLVAVGLAASRLMVWFRQRSDAGPWERRIGMASGVVLAAIGLGMLAGGWADSTAIGLRSRLPARPEEATIAPSGNLVSEADWPMSIRSIDLFHVAVPLRKPIKHASHARTVSDNLVVRVALAGGAVGFGEGVPRPYVTGETIETTFEALSRFDAARQLGTPADFDEAVARIDEVRLPETEADPRGMAGNAARCALELALLDAYGRVFREPLHRAVSLLAGRRGLSPSDVRSTPGPVRYSGAITAESGRKERLGAWKMRLYGFAQVKVKVGVAGQDDPARLEVLRRILGRRMDIRIDANEAWAAHGLVETVRPLLPSRPTALEQPVPHAEVRSLAELRPRLGVPVMLDESLCGLPDALRAREEGTADLFNVRLSKCGGIGPSLQIMATARAPGDGGEIGIQLGCHPGETGLLSAAGRHVAGLVDRLRYVEGSYDRHVLAENLTVKDITFGYGGRARPLSGPGLGVTVDPAALERMTLARREVRYD